MLTLRQRVEHFNDTYAAQPRKEASRLWIVQEQGHDVIYGRWVIGAMYANKSRFYGAYPGDYLVRMDALFPDFRTPKFPGHVLHVFSGSLPASPNYERCDLIQPAELQCSVLDLPRIVQNYHPRLIYADPPYGPKHAEKYGTPMINRAAATRALSQITSSGALLVWLDVKWPMHRKDQWRTVGRIALTRSTNHDTRDSSIFERV